MKVEARIKGCSRSMKQTLIDNPQMLQDFLEQQGVGGSGGNGEVLILPQDLDTLAREVSTSTVDPIDHF